MRPSPVRLWAAVARHACPGDIPGTPAMLNEPMAAVARLTQPVLVALLLSQTSVCPAQHVWSSCQ